MPPGNTGNARPPAGPNRRAARQVIADFLIRTWLGNVLASVALVFGVLGVAWTIYTGIISLRYGATQTCAALYSIGKFSEYCNKTLEAGVTPAPMIRRHLTDVWYWNWDVRNGERFPLDADLSSGRLGWQRLLAGPMHLVLSTLRLTTNLTNLSPGTTWAVVVLMLAVAIFAVICLRLLNDNDVAREGFDDSEFRQGGATFEVSEVLGVTNRNRELCRVRTTYSQSERHDDSIVVPDSSDDSSEDLEDAHLDPATIAKLTDQRAPQKRTAYVYSDDGKEGEDHAS
ncbi:hypothetical protein LTR27_001252 [Elasticomyces elasticus]|nr:hypothetical protein LTR27_001252 [Elasticomyces elasticus]